MREKEHIVVSPMTLERVLRFICANLPNEALESIGKRKHCDKCGADYIILYSGAPIDIVVWNNNDGGGWQVLEGLEIGEEYECDCENSGETEE